MADYFEVKTVREREGKDAVWTRVGTMWPARQGDGFSITLDALPLPGADGSVRLIISRPKPKDGQQQSRQGAGHSRQADHAPSFDSDIPF